MTNDSPAYTPTEKDHLANLGAVVIALSHHEPGDFGGSNPNDPITTLVDLERPAHELLRALADMSVERAAGIARQAYIPQADWPVLPDSNEDASISF